MTEYTILKKQKKKNTLIINDFNDFRDFLDKNNLDKCETALTLACAIGINMCKKTNADTLKLESHLTGNNENDFISGDIQIQIKNIKYKK